MNRRDFPKLIVAGKVRLAWATDIDRDEMLFRLDVSNDEQQFMIEWSIKFNSNEKVLRQNFRKKKKVAQELLRKELISQKWKATDLVALPVAGNPLLPWMA